MSGQQSATIATGRGRAGAASTTVGIRELRDGLSRYLERVKAGEGLTITEHGRPIARLEPVARHTLAELIALGLATPPTRPLSHVADLRPVVPHGSVIELLHDDG
jgi:prevent-host-death family protein